MTSTVLVKQLPTQGDDGEPLYQWLATDSSAPSVGGELSVQQGDISSLANSVGSAGVLLIASAEVATLYSIGFQQKERKLLRQTLPYEMEDELVDDVEELHFSLGEADEQQVPLVIMKRSDLQGWLQVFENAAIEVQQVIPELQLLAATEQQWSLLVEADRWLLSAGRGGGFAMEPECAVLAMQLLLDENEHLPNSLRVYAEADIAASEDWQATVSSQLPDMLAGIVEWQSDSFWSLAQQQLASMSSINLLQGEFARSLPWQRWWQQWRLALILCAAAVVLQTGINFGQLQGLKQENLLLRTDIEKAYRSAIPKGAVMDHERQLRRRVQALQGGGGAGFMSIFESVAIALAAQKGVSIQSLNYNERQSEVRLTVLAPNFQAVEAVRSAIEKKGLQAEMTGSSNEGNQTRARLRIKE